MRNNTKSKNNSQTTMSTLSFWCNSLPSFTPIVLLFISLPLLPELNNGQAILITTCPVCYHPFSTTFTKHMATVVSVVCYLSRGIRTTSAWQSISIRDHNTIAATIAWWSLTHVRRLSLCNQPLQFNSALSNYATRRFISFTSTSFFFFFLPSQPDLLDGVMAQQKGSFKKWWKNITGTKAVKGNICVTK